MSDLLHNSEALVRYLDGDMSREELEQMEKQLRTDPALQEELNSLRTTREAVRIYGLTQDVSRIRASMQKETPVKRMSPRRKWVRYSISAAATILLIITGYLAYNFFMLSPDAIYRDRYVKYEISNVRDGNTELSNVEKAYMAGRYNQVLSLQQEGDTSSTAIFLAGLSQLERHEHGAAIRYLKSLADRPGTRYHDEAEYYMALAYIKNRDYDLALPILEGIRDNPAHLYHEKVSSRFVRKIRMLKWR